LINKTFKQLNAERAARRAGFLNQHGIYYDHRAKNFQIKKQKKNKASSSQAGGPAPKGSGFKQLRLTSDKLIRYYRTHR